MEQNPAVMWICLLGATLALVLPPAVSLTSLKTDPRPPRLIGCVFINRANVTCSWEPGDTPATHYTLQVKRIPGIRRSNISFKSPLTTFSCTTSGTNCTAALNGSSVRFTFNITVTAHSQSEDIVSQSRCQSGRIEVMLPPAILKGVKPVKERPQCLNVTWSSILSEFPVSHPEIKAGNLTSQIQFTAKGQLDVQVQNVTVRDYSFLVCVFRPYTSYSIRLRHRYLSAMSPWSPWSNEAQGGTAEDAPSEAPAFWRQVKQTDMNGWRRISLLWQPLPLSLANGRVLFYNVTCETESSHVLNDPGSCRDLDHASTSCSLLLPAGRCSCSLTASTSGGTSPEAQIWLLGASEAEPPSISNLSASPLDDRRLDVRWTAPADWPSSGYMVEWFAVRDKNSSIHHWKRLNSSCTALVITEGVQPWERFAVSVRALYGERGAGQNRTIYIYTLQGVPSAGPVLEVKQISGSSVKLTWTAVPVEWLRGFLRNYTLYFKTATQPAKSVSVPAQANSYSLRNLSPGRNYIFMQANTDPGAGIVGNIANVHIGSDEASLVVWAVLPLILTSLVLVAVACLAQTMVKKKLFQDVPNPSQSSLADWTPKPALEGMKWPADKIQMKYSEVVLLGESKLLNSDHDKEDLTYKSLCNLQTYSLNGYNHFPVSGAQTCNKSSAKAKTSSDSDLSAIYSDVLTSQTPQSLQKPLLTLSHLQYDWQHSIISVSDVELQPEGDSDLDASLQSTDATDSESPLSQTYALKVLCHTQSQSSDSSSVSLSSVFISPPAEVKSPQHLFLKKIYNSVPTLQSDTFTHPDNLCGTMSALPFPRSMFVDFSYSPVGYDDPYVSPAV